MTPEEKVFEKIIRVLAADSTIDGYVQKRIYASHISSVKDPEYPAISLFLLDSSPNETPSLKDMTEMIIQIDIWLSSDEHTTEDIFILQRRIRALLHRQDLTDTSLSLISMQSIETSSGQMMYEQDPNILHLPMRYAVTAL